MSTLSRSFRNHRYGAVYDPRFQWKSRFAIVKAKAFGMDCTRSLRPEKLTRLLTSCSIEVLVRSECDFFTYNAGDIKQ